MNTRDRIFWTEFLQLYRSLPAVWKVKSPEYSSRAMKTAGYEQLVKKLREVEPHADRALVVKKINSFRTNLRRDLRKREQSSAEEPFVSTLWYFDLLGFLEGQEGSLHKQPVSGSELEAPPEALHDLKYPKKKRRLAAVKNELPESPAPTSFNSPSGERSSSLSASEALAHTWRSQFDELSARQKLLARKLISDVLYYGCMDQLQPSHVSQLQQMMLHDPHIGNVASSPLANRWLSLDNYDDSDEDILETSSNHSRTSKTISS